MMVCRIALLFLAGIALALSSAAVVSPSENAVDSKDEKSADGPFLLDGIDIDLLTEEERRQLADAEDTIFEGEIDITVGKKAFLIEKSRRPKRWIPLAGRALFAAGRALFRGFTRGGLSRSGTRLTRQYIGRGSYQDAVNRFRQLNPSNVRNFRTNRLEGMTGTVGRHRVTVRSSSSNGSPTLEIRSPRDGGEFVRKFRFNQP